MESIRPLCAVAVLAHFGVSFAHGHAHTQLGVGLATWQWYYVYVVITLAPFLALALLWTRRVRVGLVLLMLSMAGALLFGVYYHYVFTSPDNVSHLPLGSAQGLFRATAALLVMTELFGLIIALIGFRRGKADPPISTDYTD
ncbi:MAG TPA: hypothetical protein VIG25_20965 [Pyrinomonadaceae bacterium]